ncbi:MAG TPA: glycogen synthase GlgA [Candidatus Hydrogenedentes bacterium]|nr:glycogen synthase GlgA [Candidatus Hydrogenedentota bacterium]
MTKPLKILYVSAELAPLASTGGLGDVANALPRALHALGHDVRLAVPCYQAMPEHLRGAPMCNCDAPMGVRTVAGTFRLTTMPGTDIPLYLVQNDRYFDRPDIYGPGGNEYPDAMERFCFFSMAVLDGVGKGDWVPDVVHCNDWHTAIIPAHIKTRLATDPVWRGMPTILTIHNLAYQGECPASKLPETGLSWALFTPDCLEFYGHINLMKAGIAFASRTTAVSPRYAREIQTPEFGGGLDGFLRTRARGLTGILNGIDYERWNPDTDADIPANYTPDDLSGKAACKTALQQEFNLPARDVPLFGMVSRINWQKGFDLLPTALDRALAGDIQVFILGSGDGPHEDACAAVARRHPDRMRVVLRYAPPLARKVYAASDFFLMPSRFEPCGLSQLYALAYGAIPIVRRTGGLADTVYPVTARGVEEGRSTGLVFVRASSAAIFAAMRRAVKLFEDKERLHAVRLAAMRQRFSWDASAVNYARLYRQAIRNP